ncbi:glycosyltransferase family 2 protein [Butyrivibrio sp. INlla16]|uniref:glycosyltransferase family 2 protein n=1 Tax=Butyrivibrio sp. INlla16 TaxID=1520807 RepID=UPI00088B4985|nr:glycosyltransferase family 2 protein [Butyrivibrio sp. INlla16]SDB67283.1 Glycosyltransferase involved in cell wall bisynthesis [Butyrivibrio sp. INlla16]
MKKIDIVIPCYNESGLVKDLYNELAKMFDNQLAGYKFSCIFIDDGSGDDTLRHIEELAEGVGTDSARYISFTRNFGKEAAIFAGLQNSTADYVAVMDADLQHPPILLAKMLHAIENEGYDCATARRIPGKGESKAREFFSKCFCGVINWATGMELVSGMTDYRLMKREVVNAIVSMQERERFIKGIYSWIGFKNKWIEYESVERAGGKSKWSYRGLWNYAKSGIIAFAPSPLRGVIWLGMVVVFISFVYAIKLYINSVTGARPWKDTTTIILLLLFIGGVIITVLGVIGEYIARIYMEVKRRPIYLVGKSNIL